MANKKIKHIVAKLLGATTEETLDIYDESALHATDIVDNLTSTDATKVLSAKQGKALNDSLATVTSSLASYQKKISFELVKYTASVGANAAVTAPITAPTAITGLNWRPMTAYTNSGAYGVMEIQQSHVIIRNFSNAAATNFNFWVVWIAA